MTVAIDVSVAIIGAGPKGVSIALRLWAMGIRDIVVLDRGHVVGTWDSRYAGTSPTRTGMHFSDTLVPGDSALGPLERYALHHPLMNEDLHAKDILPKEVLQDYYHDALLSSGIPALLNTPVVSLQFDQRTGASIETAIGRMVRSKVVVNATGIVWSKNWPRWAKQLPPDRCYHSIGHGSLQDLVGKRILIVGGGHATPDIAVRMVEQGAQVDVCVRARRFNQQLLPYSTEFLSEGFQRQYHHTDYATRYRILQRLRGAGPWVTPRSYGEMMKCLRVNSSAIELRMGTYVESAEWVDGEVRVRLNDTLERAYDYVICATGFEVPKMGNGPFRWPEHFWEGRSHKGFPLLDRAYRSLGAEWLYTVGHLAQLGPRGPIDAILYGTQITTSAVAESIENQLRSSR